MILYTKDSQQTDFSNYIYLKEGGCGKIYKYDDTILKVYKKDCNHHLKIKKQIFELLKAINAPCIVKLDNYYFSKKRILNPLTQIDAYTMEYIKEEQFNLIDCDKKFIIEIFTKLEQTIRELSFYDIVIDDINSKNIILNKNGITLIDPDLFFKKGFGYKCSAYRLNKIRILDYINLILTKKYYEKEEQFIYFYIEENIENTLIEDVQNSLTENTFYESMNSKKLKLELKKF